ncbi:Hypothetical protein D9617_38g090960 [Elsinoe fawcettii]|nr:Hypothetical protein D9617_38g090960 [Elsinoe fawcettii]
MAPTTRSGVRGASRSTNESLPRKRRQSASSASSASETERAPALPKKRSLRRLMTIELPAAELRRMDRVRQEETTKTTPSPPSTAPPAPSTPPAEEATSSPPPSATPRPWGFGSFLTSVRRILSPFPPSKRELTPIAEESPRRQATPAAPAASMPAPPSMARKRRASDDTTSTPKRVKYSARRSAKNVREHREAIAESTASPIKFTTITPLSTSSTHKISSATMVESTTSPHVKTGARPPASSPSPSSPPASVESTTGRPAMTGPANTPPSNESHTSTAVVELTAISEAETTIGKKRKRVKIDELKYIPSRRPGQSTGTFALLDEFFIEDEDSVEVDESQVELVSERPSKRTRTGNNVFDLASPQKTNPPSTSPKKRTRSISPTKRSRYMSPEKSSFLGTPSTLADKIPTPARVQFAVPEDDSDEDSPATPMDAASNYFNDASQTPESAKMQSIRQTVPQTSASLIELDTPPSTSRGTPMDTAVSQRQTVVDDEESAILTSPDGIAIDTPCPQGPGQQLDSLQRKRSEAEKYKPQRGSRLKEMQRLSSTSSLFESPQRGFIAEESTSPTDAPPEYLLQDPETTSPTTTPPTHTFNAPAPTPLSSTATAFTPRDTPQESNIFAAPGASPITSKFTSFTPAGPTPSGALFSPARATAPEKPLSTPATSTSYTSSGTAPSQAKFTPASSSASAFTPPGTTPSQPRFSPGLAETYTPKGPTPDRAIFTPPPMTSYTPPTVSFTPLESPPAGILSFPGTSPTTSSIPTTTVTDLPDSEQTEQRIASAAQIFSAGVRDFGVFQPLAVA